MNQYNEELVRQMIEIGDVASRELNDQLYPLVVAGDDAARKKMIEANMSFVLYKVDSYLRCFPDRNYLRDDLISEGFVGLIRGVNKMVEKGPVEDPNPTGYLSFWIYKGIGEVADADGIGVSSRTIQRHRAEGEELPKLVSMHDVPLPNGKIVDPTTMIELRDLIDSCCETDIDRAIVRMREKANYADDDSDIGTSVSSHPGFVDKEIAKILGIPVTTTYMLRRAIYQRFLQKSGMKGEV